MGRGGRTAPAHGDTVVHKLAEPPGALHLHDEADLRDSRPGDLDEKADVGGGHQHLLSAELSRQKALGLLEIAVESPMCYLSLGFSHRFREIWVAKTEHMP